MSASEACSSAKWFWWKIFCIISTQVTWMSLSEWILMAGRQNGADFKSAGARKEVSGEKRQIASAFTAFATAEFCPKFLISTAAADTKFRAHIYRTSCENLLCIFRLREGRSEKWHRLHLQLCPNIWLDAEIVHRIITREMSSIVHIYKPPPNRRQFFWFLSNCYGFLSCQLPKVRAMLPISYIVLISQIS